MILHLGVTALAGAVIGYKAGGDMGLVLGAFVGALAGWLSIER